MDYNLNCQLRLLAQRDAGIALSHRCSCNPAPQRLVIILLSGDNRLVPESSSDSAINRTEDVDIIEVSHDTLYLAMCRAGLELFVTKSVAGCLPESNAGRKRFRHGGYAKLL